MTIAHVLPTSAHADRLRSVAALILRYSLVALMLLWGGAKFFEFEAVAIKPLVENSPLVSWMYSVFGLRGTSAIFGLTEVPAALLIASYRWFPRASAYASLVACVMFLTTLSFLFTTPGGGGAMQGFLLKDLVLLGAALFTAAESFDLDAERVREPIAG